MSKIWENKIVGLLFLDTSSVIVFGVTGGFGSFDFRPPRPGDQTGSDHFPACVQEALAHSLSLWIHWVQSVCPVKPLPPTSMGHMPVLAACVFLFCPLTGSILSSRALFAPTWQPALVFLRTGRCWVRLVSTTFSRNFSSFSQICP